MKKFALMLSLVALLGLSALAQSTVQYRTRLKTPYKSNITINPIIFLDPNFVDIKYEHAINDLFSIAFNPVYYNMQNSDNYEFFNFWVQGRFYLSKNDVAPRGWFIAPEMSVGLLKAKINERIEAAQTVNTGFITGYQFSLKRRFIIDLYAGVTRYNILNNSVLKEYVNVFVLPSWGLSMGYAF